MDQQKKLLAQKELVRSFEKGFELMSEEPLLYGEKCIIKCAYGHLISTPWREIKSKLGNERFCSNCFMIKKMRNRAIEKGFTLLSEEWKGYTESYKFLCPNHHEQKYIWKYFNDHEGNHCIECYNEKVANGKHGQTTSEFKKEQENALLTRMEKMGYRLSDEYSYQSSRDYVPMICSRGHNYTPQYSHFMQGKKCRKCSYEDSMISEQDLITELSTMGYKYLGEYTGVNSPLKYVCTCGNITRKRIADIRKGQKCMRCAKKQSIEKRRQERVLLLEKEFGEKRSNF